MGKLETKVKNLFLRLFKKNLMEVISTEAGPALINKILDQYELELFDIAPVTDPTAPEFWQDEFSELLYQDLEESIEITNRGVSFGLGDKDALGFDSPPSTESQDVLKTFVYILEGIIGEYAWITPEVYTLKKPWAEWEGYGRFGEGFLMPRDQFEEEEWDDVISFEEVRWGFSDSGPKDIFFNAYADFDWSPYLIKAVEKTVKELQGKTI
jgi:hypothetical protein